MIDYYLNQKINKVRIINTLNNKIIWLHTKLIDNTKNRKNVQSLEVAEVVFFQSNIVAIKINENRKCYTLLRHKSYAYLLNI